VTTIITTPVPQSKVPPDGRPGYSTTVWLDSVLLGELGGHTSEEALQNAQKWLRYYRGDKCNERQSGENGGRICDMLLEHRGLHTDGEMSWGSNLRLVEQEEKLPDPTEPDE
jgi:hypothetical protein